MNALSQARVYFDGECALCRKSVAVLRKLDWFHKLTYIDFRSGEAPQENGSPVAQARLIDEMHLASPAGRLYHGFGAFRWMAWRLPLLLLFAPFLYLPGVPWLGQKIYLWIARNRFQLVPCQDGECQLPAKKSTTPS